MVTNSRASAGVDRLRPLAVPRSIGVRVDGSQEPVAVRTRDGWVDVDLVVDHWRLSDEWWREEPLVRWYYRVSLVNDRSMTVFYDRLRDVWLQQEYGGARFDVGLR